MPKIIKTYSLTLMLLIASLGSLLAQTDPTYSQYMFNVQAFNPAYTGSWNNMGLTLLNRSQYLGFEGNPGTQSLTLQFPLMKQKMGTGITLINDQVGHLQHLSLMVDYAYGIKLGRDLTWRLGLKAGFNNYRQQFTSYQLVDTNDPAFTQDTDDLFLPNVGIGTYLHSRLFYLGISSPALLNNRNNTQQNTFDPQLINAIAGVVIPLFKGLDLKPSAHLRYHLNGLWVADVNFSFLLAKKFWIGSTFRTSDELGLAFNTSFLIGDRLRLGYAYDMMKSNGFELSRSGSHEFMLSYEFQWEKTEYVSPRWF